MRPADDPLPVMRNRDRGHPARAPLHRALRLDKKKTWAPDLGADTVARAGVTDRQHLPQREASARIPFRKRWLRYPSPQTLNPKL